MRVPRNYCTHPDKWVIEHLNGTVVSVPVVPEIKATLCVCLLLFHAISTEQNEIKVVAQII